MLVVRIDGRRVISPAIGVLEPDGELERGGRSRQNRGCYRDARHLAAALSPCSAPRPSRYFFCFASRLWPWSVASLRETKGGWVSERSERRPESPLANRDDSSRQLSASRSFCFASRLWPWSVASLRSRQLSASRYARRSLFDRCAVRSLCASGQPPFDKQRRQFVLVFIEAFVISDYDI
jgi:hypothetical protein